MAVLTPEQLERWRVRLIGEYDDNGCTADQAVFLANLAAGAARNGPAGVAGLLAAAIDAGRIIDAGDAVMVPLALAMTAVAEAMGREEAERE